MRQNRHPHHPLGFSTLAFASATRWLAAGAMLVALAGAVSADAATTAAKDSTSAQPVVNINTATATQLGYLPGVGKALAGRVIEYRTQHGALQRVTDLRQVKGFGDALVSSVAPHVVLTGQTTATAKIHGARSAHWIAVQWNVTGAAAAVDQNAPNLSAFAFTGPFASKDAAERFCVARSACAAAELKAVKP